MLLTLSLESVNVAPLDVMLTVKLPPRVVTAKLSERLDSNTFAPATTCVFNVDDKVDLNTMKEYINNHGIESSVFYGKKSYFVPSHQNLEKGDIEYIFTVVKSFLEDHKK